MAVTVRLAGGSPDTTGIQQLASRLWPQGLHPGGLGWSMATDQLANVVAVADDDGLVGWAGVAQPGDLMLQVDPTRPTATTSLIAWLLDTATGDQVGINVFDGDQVVRDAVRAAGFVISPPDPSYYGMRGVGLRRAAVDLDVPVATGYRVRSVRADEFAERVEVHRRAWHPAQLPWHPDHRPTVDPAATSSFRPEYYERVRSTWLYDTGLDLVVEAPDGSLAGCCIGWFDPATGWAEIEPLGIVPGHRGRGLAGSLCLEVAHRVVRAGGTNVFINTGPSAGYPAPYGAYAKAGFTAFDRSTHYSLAR